MFRINIFEFEDFNWIPSLIRDEMTNYLGDAIKTSRQFDPVVKLLAPILSKLKINTIIDLCTGSGIPGKLLSSGISKELSTPIKLVLTDKYTNVKSMERIIETSSENIEAVYQSVDARDIGVNISGFRTLFNALHHFNPRDAFEILNDASKKNEPIGVFEIVDRKLFLPFLIFSPIGYLLSVFFGLKSNGLFSLKFFLLYLIPIVPIMIIWDGIASCLRAYSKSQMQEFTNRMQLRDYTWIVGHTFKFPNKINYIIGYPKLVENL